MSNARFRNAAKVWHALDALTGTQSGALYARFWWTVGEVAKKANMSKPTVRRYLEMAHGEGAVLRCERPHGWEYRILTEEERDGRSY